MQKSNILQHHAHLWIGDPTTLHTHTIEQLQQLLCTQHGCKKCVQCNQIKDFQHPWVTWIKPDGSYTVDQIDEILQTVRFKLNPQEQRFLIFTQADELTTNCNNRLLKTVEEPHSGYFFIFLTNRTDNILPTLSSRCFIQEFNQITNNHRYAEILEPFLKGSLHQPAEFIKMIDSYEIKESETKDILDLLIQNFHQQLKVIHTEQDDKKISSMLAITDNIVVLKKALSELPVPGSCKMFWKNLYLSFHQQQ